jgi:hypothetical protein
LLYDSPRFTDPDAFPFATGITGALNTTKTLAPGTQIYVYFSVTKNEVEAALPTTAARPQAIVPDLLPVGAVFSWIGYFDSANSWQEGWIWSNNGSVGTFSPSVLDAQIQAYTYNGNGINCANPVSGQDYLKRIYGVELTSPNGSSYWTPERVNHVWRVVDYLDSIFFAINPITQTSWHDVRLLDPSIPNTPGSRFLAVFGAKTEFQFTGETRSFNAEALVINSNHNLIELYDVSRHQGTGIFGRSWQVCGSRVNANPPTTSSDRLDLNHCTVMHELLGHIFMARSRGGLNTGVNPPEARQILINQVPVGVFGHLPNPICTGNLPVWDPGEILGWGIDPAIPNFPIRANPVWQGTGVSNYSSYNTALCTEWKDTGGGDPTNPLTLRLEFEADMLMNYALGFLQHPNANCNSDPQCEAQKVRAIWVVNLINGVGSNPQSANLIPNVTGALAKAIAY